MVLFELVQKAHRFRNRVFLGIDADVGGHDHAPLKLERDGHSSGDYEPSKSNSFGRPLYDVYDMIHMIPTQTVLIMI
jgi:hypothetical protein